MTALQTERERPHAAGGVVGNLLDEGGRVGFGVESLRPGLVAGVLEGRVDHPHVHQHPFGLRAGISQLAVNVPLAVGDAHTRRGLEVAGWCRFGRISRRAVLVSAQEGGTHIRPRRPTNNQLTWKNRMGCSFASCPGSGLAHTPSSGRRGLTRVQSRIASVLRPAATPGRCWDGGCCTTAPRALSRAFRNDSEYPNCLNLPNFPVDSIPE